MCRVHAAWACASGYFDPVIGAPVVGGGWGLADTLVRVMPETLPPSSKAATGAASVSAKKCLFEPRAVIVAAPLGVVAGIAASWTLLRRNVLSLFRR